MSPQRARRTAEKLSHAQKLSLYMRDNFTCVWCLTQYPEDNLSVDHIIPRSLDIKRPSGHPKTQCCITACIPCNRARADMSIWRFATLIEKVSQKSTRRSVVLKMIGSKNKHRNAAAIIDYIIKQSNKPVYTVRSIRRMILEYKGDSHGKTDT